MIDLPPNFNMQTCYYPKYETNIFYKKDDYKYFEPKTKYNIKSLHNSNFKTIIIDDKSFYILNIYSTLIETIEKSTSILKLSACWDGEDAKSIEKGIYFETITYLINLTEHIYKNYNIIISSPEINPCRDGSLDLEWRTSENVLLINLKNDMDLDIHYYGENKITNNSIKGISKDNSLNEDLCFWMKKLI
jgi:hypothetical protein